MRILVVVLLAGAAIAFAVLGRGEGDAPALSTSAPSTESPPRQPPSARQPPEGENLPGEQPAEAGASRDDPGSGRPSEPGRTPEASLEWAAPAAAALVEGRWAEFEEARQSIADAGPGEALRLLAAGRRLDDPRQALALALAIEDFLDGPARDPRVVREAAAILPALLRDAYDETGLESLRPLALRVLGHLPEERTEAFLLDRLASRPGSELEGHLVDALGRAGDARAADVLALRFESSRELEDKRLALLALSRIRDRTRDEGVAELVDRSARDLVAHAAVRPPAFEDEEWYYVTLGLIQGSSPAQAIADRILLGDATPAARESALAWLERSGGPDEAAVLDAAALRTSDRDLARRLREVAARLAGRSEPPSTGQGDGR